MEIGVEYKMFQSLMERPPVTQELLGKLTGELIARHDTRQGIRAGELAADLAGLTQEMRLYGEVLEQLSPHTLALRAYHHQLFRLLDFLARRPTTPPSLGHSHPPAYCTGCTELVEQRNIRQLHRELVSSEPMKMRDEREERESAGSAEVEECVAQEEALVRRMGSLQQNISERQVNLVRCIDDFEVMRNDMLLGLRRREFGREFDSFDLKAYSIHLTTHFLTTLNRLELKIAHLKRSIHALEDQSTQTASFPDATPPPPKIETKPPTGRTEADFRKVNDQKVRAEENCRRWQLQAREAQAKAETLEAQIKALREEVATEKLRRQAREREREKERAMRSQELREEERARKEGLGLLMGGDQLAGEFETRFLENYAGSRRMSEEDMVPLIKATFKRTFEGFFRQRLSLNLARPSPSPSPSYSPLPPTRELDSPERRRVSRRVHGQEGELLVAREMSRFGHKKAPSNFQIVSQVSLKVAARPQPASPAPTSELSSYKRSVLYTEGSVKRTRNHYSNLQSILSEFKENRRGRSNDGHAQALTLQAEHLEQLPVRQVQKGKRIKLSRNHSQLLDVHPAKHLQVDPREAQALRLQGLKLTIDSTAVKQFLFLNELEEVSVASVGLAAGARRDQPLSIDSFKGVAGRKEKAILNLEEINYLTNFYSLLAKIHMLDPDTYAQLKRWILSKDAERAQNSRQSAALKQVVSQIVFKHRECTQAASLCPHLLDFLRELESTLKGVEST